eukprot:TRINITY_DN7301_c0_g1_i1.p1 TRINITY_DN7301_c0_g1~~TRINITY_DN7301_c0_g1_i1.p1  ORF type:complete len:616 (+),score=150.69 TRINITY_DN7301_c0_g1_i1:66-1850(+)
MPTVSVSRDDIIRVIGEDPETYTDKQFDELCFEFGIELDEVTSESEILAKSKGTEVEEVTSDKIIYKIDMPANRYDLLCFEGIQMALNVFLGRVPLPVYKTVKGPEVMVVDKSVLPVRPIVVCGVLRDITFTEKSYASFIDLQDKLHHNICRLRTLASVGTHDLDTIKGPFKYQALAPKDIEFAPLNQTQKFTGETLMKHYETDLHLRRFLHIIRDEPAYPVITDANGVVLSLPPIINGDHSKISLKTKNVFIEVTATDRTKATVVLNTICAMFSQCCAGEAEFTVEEVTIQEADGTKRVTPDFSTRPHVTTVEYINRSLGLELGTDAIVKMLNRMSVLSHASEDGKEIVCEVPITRADIMQACDIMEDVAIGYGYNNLPFGLPNTPGVGKPSPVNKLTDLLRVELGMAGYTEALPLSLCSHQENFDFLRQKDDGKTAVVLGNPKTIEYQEGRVSLLPGIFKTAAHNRQHSLPLRMFEVYDVMLKDPAVDVGARNERRLCAYYANTTPGFEVIRGVLDLLMIKMGVPLADKANKDVGYRVEQSENPTFFPGRQGSVIVNGKSIGYMGVVHPEVLSAFKLVTPCSAIELNIESFV